MFNVTVLKAKDLIKYFIEILLVTILIFLVINFIKAKDGNNDNKNDEKKISFTEYDLTGCIDTTSGIIKNLNKSDNYEIQAYESNLFEDILKSQIGSVDEFGEVDDTKYATDNEETNQNQDSDTNSENIEKSPEESQQNLGDMELAKTGLNTEVITNNPIALNYNTQYENVKIKNETSHELTAEMLNPNVDISNKNILLFHTHTCESYTSSEQYSYTPTGNFRTTDLNYTVVKVGDELERQMKQYGYNVIHDRTYHDYPSYNGSYTHSLGTEQNILKNNPTDIIFDIHRDAIGSRSDYAPTVKIGDDEAAQIMFVVGSDEGGLWHPNWNQNLKFAIKVQEKAEEMYPGLFKPITLTKYRYNQHSGKYASIIEVGATGNTMEQCLNSMKYLAKVLDEIMKNP